MKPYTYKCVIPTITACVLSLLFKQGQPTRWEAALLLAVSSATFVFQATIDDQATEEQYVISFWHLRKRVTTF